MPFLAGAVFLAAVFLAGALAAVFLTAFLAGAFFAAVLVAFFATDFFDPTAPACFEPFVATFFVAADFLVVVAIVRNRYFYPDSPC